MVVRRRCPGEVEPQLPAADVVHIKWRSGAVCGLLTELFEKKTLTQFWETDIYEVLCVLFGGGDHGIFL